MKKFDISLKERIRSKVFVKDRLSKLELIVRTLVTKIEFSLYDKMIIECIAKEVRVLKNLSVDHGVDISLRLSKLSETIFLLLKKSQTTIDISNRLSTEKRISITPVDLQIENSPAGIYYLALISGETPLDIATSTIREMIYAKVLHPTNGLKTDINLQSKLGGIKNITIAYIEEITSFIQGVLKKTVSPIPSNIQIECSADIGLARYRQLWELDSLTIGELDAMTLRDIDLTNKFPSVVKLLSSEGYVLIDSNGLYLTVKEDE